MSFRPVVCLMGATATGKTELGLALADALPVDLISVDSALVYRGMNIGTAKPDADTLRRYPHALIDCCEPEDAYSAARFVQDATRHIGRAHEAGRLPVLVGGTHLYYRALLHGLSELPSADPRVRAAIAERAAVRGWPALHAELAAHDPDSASRIHPNDAQRIQRALEIIELSGRTPSEHFRHLVSPARAEGWSVLSMAIGDDDRAALHARIGARFDQMMRDGFLEELETLRRRPGLRADYPSMRSVGYRQLWRYLDGDCSLDEAVEAGKAATRQLARRQWTWLRKEPALRWLRADEAPRERVVALTKDHLLSGG
ncbi:tRNA (adenosine(37)-N6)-dimethylallyltransferase MiaA [uncultured Abyssibacter sp.]|uniref:tRNA (adenosine(37)-N6)-dimethylallyltransferase MiaA n=1 Tax=uncultured Abyssibacter sp. TaxID=2320202 RepID=UPI0032B28B4A